MAKKKKKTKKGNTEPVAVAPKDGTEEAAGKKGAVQSAGTEVGVGTRDEGMPKFDLNAPSADEIQAAAASTESMDASAEVARKAVLDTHEKLKLQEAPPQPVLQEKIQVPAKIEICQCEWGYGVFASARIEDGDTIEEAPFITLPIRTGDGRKNPKAAALLPHVIPIACACKECMDLGMRVVISSGYIQMYNHSDDPNARLLQHKANKRVYVVEALKPIEAGEQIFINYGPGYPKEWLRPPHIRSTDE